MHAVDLIRHKRHGGMIVLRGRMTLEEASLPTLGMVNSCVRLDLSESGPALAIDRVTTAAVH